MTAMIKKSPQQLQQAWQEYDEWLKKRTRQPWENARFDVDGPEVVDPSIIETFPYWYKGSKAIFTIETDEFVSVCPWSGLPDFANLRIDYVPHEVCIELKSLKYYFYSWRNVGMFYEHIINKLLQDLVEVAQPVWLQVRGEFNVRGGLSTSASAQYGQRPKPDL